MADYRRIMALLLQGRSYREVVETAGCSHRDVARAKQVIGANGITSVEGVSDAEVAGWFPDGRRRVSDEYERPEFESVLQALKHRRHFTLLQGWRRYADAAGTGKKKYGYAQYCALFSEWARTNDLVAVLRHEPGRAMHVDWAGDTLDVVDRGDGSVVKAFLFVAVLPYSGAVFCRAYPNTKSEAWLDAHVQAFSFYGGVPQLVVPDNPTTSTHQRHKGDAERVVNARYQQLADHYQCAIVPARAKRPRDKAAAESAVNVVNLRVIGYLEGETWFSVSELNEAIDERVREVNQDLKRADDSTRWERFETEEQHLLTALPDARFEEVAWKQLKAARNYHITADYQHYSVPYSLAGQLLRVRLTSSRVTVFNGNEVVSEHPRLSGRKGQYSTLGVHVPDKHRDIDGLWSRTWFSDRARSFGPATQEVIEQILDRHQIEAQGYLDCQNILGGLGKKNRQRLEAACGELLARGGYPTYTTLKRLMAAIDSDAKAPRTIRPAASTRKHTESQGDDPGPEVYVRDASHYEIGSQGAAQ